MILTIKHNLPVILLRAFLLFPAVCIAGCGHEEKTAVVKKMASAGEKTTRPDIIIITIDTLRADHLGCYGYFRNTSPAIDELARNGILFERTMTPMGTTLPAHVSLMTSTTTLKHGIKANMDIKGDALDASDGLLTFAQIAGRAGYITAGFVSAAPVKKHSGMATGFDIFDEPKSKARLAASTNKGLFSWLKKNSKRPLFLWIHYWDPHEPYSAPGKYRNMFSEKQKIRKFLKKKKVPNMVSYVLRKNNRYDGEIRYVDDQINRLFDVLKKKGVFDDSIIVITGDHGEGLGQHYWIDHGRIYDEQLHVPLIIKLPDGSDFAGIRRSGMSSLIDIVPTVASEAGIELTRKERNQFQGVDLLKDVPARKYVLSERSHRRRNWEPGMKYTLTGPEWKYHYYTDWQDELYNLKNDPGETINVIEDNAQIARKMKNIIETEIAKYESRTKKDEVQEIDALVLQQIESLGYVVEEDDESPEQEKEWEKNNIITENTFLELPWIRYPSGAVLDDKAVYHGLNIGREEARPGEEIELSHFWELKRPLAGWYVWVQLSAKGGKKIRDKHKPLNKLYPFKKWKIGEIVRDRHTMKIPQSWKAENVTICVGLWNRDMLMKVKGVAPDKSCVHAASIPVIRPDN